MRLCLDCAPLLGPSAGIKTYLWNLNLHLRRLAGKRKVFAFPFAGHSLTDASRLNHRGSVVGPTATMCYAALARVLNLERSPLGFLVDAWADVFHASNLSRPPRNTCLTATVFDATCWRMPETHMAATLDIDRVFVERVLRRANGVIAISEATKCDAIELLGVPPDRVVTIYPGVADAYFEQLAPYAEKSRAAIAAKYNLRQRYILFVGTIEPRKNLDRLLDAYEQLPVSLREEFQLVLAGMEGWAGRQTLERIKASAKIRYLGYVSEEDLPALTAGAVVLAYPSLSEGFGLPAVQAMASGVPVVTSGLGALREVAGDAALLVDPLSTGEIKEALQRVLTSPSLQEELRARGKTRAQQFRWHDSAAKTWDFFEQFGGGHV